MLTVFNRRLSLKSVCHPQKLRISAYTAMVGLFSIFCMTSAIIVTGCSNSVPLAKAGAISVADSNGAATKVSVIATASTLKLSMMPAGDRVNAGVDWIVTCGGNPITGSITNGACGTFSPTHTADGVATVYTAPSVVPINNSITITATATSNPSQSSSLSLTVIPAPIAVSISGASGSLPSTLNVNATLSLSDQVANDPLGAGVIWTATCGSSACGSFNPNESPGSPGTATYTAPSIVPTGGTVTVTATSLTDTTKSASATFSITTPTPPSGITVSVLPANVYVQTKGTAHTANLTAVVFNDPAAAGVDWAISCSASNCGVITAHTASGVAATYTAPSSASPGDTVAITAKSTTTPGASATATATVASSAPVTVTISTAPPATLMTGSQSTLAATVASDPGNLGVDWTANCGSAGACGTFNLSPAHTASGGQIIYTAPSAIPAGGVVTIMASSPASASNSAVAVTTIIAQSPSLSFAQAPPSSLSAAAQVSVSATVTNDVAPGGVSWTVQCDSTVPGGCGWIGPVQTASGATAIYTAPPVTSVGTSVTITATSAADPSVSISSNPIAISQNTTPYVSFVPSLPAQVQTNTMVNLTAAVANDASSAGVDWQVCASGCGFFIIEPKRPEIPATANTPYSPAVPAVTATSVSGWPNGSPIPYTAPSQPTSSGSITVVASAHADSTKTASGTIAITTGSSGPALSGAVKAGSQPVAGASVALYAAGTSGYASAASYVASATSDGSGNFTVPAGYTCPSASSQVYLVATGGKAGANTSNPNLALMTALGNCSNLGSVPVVVNEVTTIASAFATAPFAASTLNANLSYLYLGTSSGNLSGLANAFAAVNNLVDITTGQARFMTPAENAAVPYVEIDTLADMLNACTATSGGAEGDGSACSTLFTATDVLLPNDATFNAIAPSDTLQATFNIAQHPVGSSYGYRLDINQLLSLATPSSPFQPTLTTPPNDWSISLNYTSGGGLSSASTVGSFAVDATGNLWITDTANSSVIEWNATGAAISPSTGFTAGGGPIAIDANGNVWISGDGKLTELTSFGSLAPGSPFKAVTGGSSDIAIDSQSNLWIGNGDAVSEFSNIGVAISPKDGFVNNSVTAVSAVGIDSSNDIWLGNQSISSVGIANASFAELTNPGGQLIVNESYSVGAVLPEIAADNAGNFWAVVGSADVVCRIPPYGGPGSSQSLSNFCQQNTEAQALPFFNAGGLALDGAGTVWLASQGGGSLYPVSPGVVPLSPPTFKPSLSGYLTSSSLATGPLRVAVDGSGNVWVLLSNNTVTEYVGVATPVVTPIALGLKSQKLGAKP